MSDLHLETPKFLPMYNEIQIEPKAEHLALLGDIGLAVDDSLFDFLTHQLRKFKTVFYILGNHEPYSTTYEASVAKMEDFAARILSTRARDTQEETDLGASLGRFVFMDRTRFDLSPEVTILGCTLFSRISHDQESTVALFVSDFSNIVDWTVEKHNAAHRADLAWLNAEVELIFRHEPQRKVIILTHYSPTSAPEANDLEHLEDSRGVQSAFVTDLKEELCWTSPLVKIWAFGHTHHNCHFIDGKTGKLVVANQRGYGREDIFDFENIYLAAHVRRRVQQQAPLECVRGFLDILRLRSPEFRTRESEAVRTIEYAQHLRPEHRELHYDIVGQYPQNTDISSYRKHEYYAMRRTQIMEGSEGKFVARPYPTANVPVSLVEYSGLTGLDSLCEQGTERKDRTGNGQMTVINEASSS